MAAKLVPSFLPITTQECMNKFLAFDVFDVVCLKFTISKALGYAILLGAVGVKLPQLLNILKAGTVAGLSSSAYICELLCYTIFGVYNMRKGYAFSTYGENVFMSMQNLALMYCFAVFPAAIGATPSITNSGAKVMATLAGLVVYGSVVAGLYTSIEPGSSTSTFEMAIIAAPNLLILFARLPQIGNNFSCKSTGVLSVITQILNTVGCLARMFTTIQEVDDMAILATACLSFFLNFIILGQIFFYWSNTIKQLAAANETKTKKQN
jgi:mannose-P-dolichol utilization defect protein 1